MAAVDVRKVAGELGVRYVLEGSVRKSADRVRVTGQLIDAVHGVHLWADRYDRELADVFELQDDITNKVIGSVGPQILVAEAARVRRKPPQSMDAWDLVLQALPHMWRASARRAAARAGIAAAGDRDRPRLRPCARAAGLDACQPVQSGGRSSRSANSPTRRSNVGAKAVALDGEEPWAHLVLGHGPFAAAAAGTGAWRTSRNAVELNPSFALGHAGLGYALACGGEPESTRCYWARRVPDR